MTDQINSRERVINALERKPNDRTPYDFRAEPEVYSNIKQICQLASDEDVRKWAGSDVRDLGAIFSAGGFGGYSGYGWKDKELPDGIQEDFWGVQRKRVSYGEGYYTDIVHSPLKGASSAEVRSYRCPDPRTIFDFSRIANLATSLNQGNEYWMMIEVESLFDRCWTIRGMEDFMSDLLAEPDTADSLLSEMANFFYGRTLMLLQQANGCVDAIGLFNDLGTQNGMMISPALYREFIKPKQKRLIDMVKSFGVKVFYHSCGAIEPVIDDLIEIGVDILDPLQMRAMEVSPQHLKQRFGDRITLHGGLDTQSFLASASSDEVAAEVRHLVDVLGKNGGYILSGSHYYQIDIPFANLEAIASYLR